MAEYQLTANPYDGVTRTADGAYIPNAPGNVDWDRYQDWLAAGGEPDPYLPPPLPEPVPDANLRLDAGIAAAVDKVKKVVDTLGNIETLPANTPVTQEQFEALQAQVDELAQAVEAMLEAQAEPPV